MKSDNDIRNTQGVRMGNAMDTNEYFMKKALLLAQRAELAGEVPVGAVVVHDGKIIARGMNRREQTNSAVRHAEIEAIQKANKKLADWRLPDCDLYVTLEPCPMCMGAALNARIRHIYYGAPDPNSGACGGRVDIADIGMCNHNIKVTGGIMREQCSEILKGYFARRRKQNKLLKEQQRQDENPNI